MSLLSNGNGKTPGRKAFRAHSQAGGIGRHRGAALLLLLAGAAALMIVQARVDAAGGQFGRQEARQRALQRSRPPQPQQPQTEPQKPGTQPTTPDQTAQPAAARSTGVGFRLENADLLQFISLVASQLKINYVVDPAVKGSVTINTAGELRHEDLMPILESVLEINGATAVPSGNFYRIVPLKQALKAPLEVLKESNAKDLPKDDRMVMEIIPLKFVLASDMTKLLSPFLSDGGQVAYHDAGNVLILVDNSLNTKRLMDILTQFDSPAFADQRVRMVPVHNNVASALVPELQSIFSAYALNAKSSPLRFIPLDRINAILAVAADPAAFDEVEKWVTKLDQPAAPSGLQTFVYHVQNSEATYLAQLLKRIRGIKTEGTPVGAAGQPGTSMETGGVGGGGMGMGSGSRNRTAGSMRGLGFQTEGLTSPAGGQGSTSMGMAGIGALGLGMEGDDEGEETVDHVRIIADPLNNSLIFKCTAADYADIAKTLQELDVLPRQVLIEARVYEVTLSGDLTFGLEYFLQERDNQERKPLASFTTANNLSASAGMLVGQTREFLTFLNASDNRSRVRVLSAPVVLATDNTEASIQVGSEVPVLTSQAVVGGVQVGSNTLFSNTIQNEDAGIILHVKPRITSSGLVSLEIDQEISTVVPPAAGGIQSPSFEKRSIKTHTVVKDGQTVALGGLISTNISTVYNRVPLLGEIPVLGPLFGNTNYTTTKTELIVVMTPRILSSAQDAHDATRELEDRVKDLRHMFKKDRTINP